MLKTVMLASVLLLCSRGLPAAEWPTGVWVDTQYGYLLDIGRRKTRVYDLIDEHCISHVRLQNSALAGLFGEMTERSEEGLTFDTGSRRHHLRRRESLPNACKAKPAQDPLALHDLLLATLRVHHPDAAGIARIEAAAAELRPRVAGARSAQALFEALSALLEPLRDAHVSLSDGEERAFEAAPPRIGTVPRADAPTWKTQRWALKDYLDGAASPLVEPPAAAGNRRLLVGELPGDIGYVAVLAMAGYSDALDADASPADQRKAAARVFDRTFAAMADTRGLVIDLRYNEGGYDEVALALAARLATAPVRAFGKRVKGPDGLGPAKWFELSPSAAGYAGPVAVLIGPYTISAGEVGALALSALPNVRVIGEPSFGAWSDAMPKALPNGWQFTIAPEVYLDADGIPLAGALSPQQPAPTPVLGDPAQRYAPAIRAASAWVATVAADHVHHADPAAAPTRR